MLSSISEEIVHIGFLLTFIWIVSSLMLFFKFNCFFKFDNNSNEVLSGTSLPIFSLASQVLIKCFQHTHLACHIFPTNSFSSTCFLHIIVVFLFSKPECFTCYFPDSCPCHKFMILVL